MVSYACDPDDSDARWSHFPVQRSPEGREGALIPPEPQGTSLKSEVSALNPTLSRDSHEPLQLGKVHAPEQGLVEVRTALLKSFDQLAKQLLTLLVPEVEDVSEGIHNRIHAAQSIEVSLPVSAPALRHQLLVGAGERGWVGGGDPTSAGTSRTEHDWNLTVRLGQTLSDPGDRSGS
jgi:hypothetical protein